MDVVFNFVSGAVRFLQNVGKSGLPGGRIFNYFPDLIPGWKRFSLNGGV